MKKEEKVKEKEIFEERIFKSNVFSKDERRRIREDYLLYKKCYYLGVLDKYTPIQ